MAKSPKKKTAKAGKKPSKPAAVQVDAKPKALPELTAEDRHLLNLVFMHGLSALVERGMSAAQVQAFVTRPEVMNGLMDHVGEFANREQMLTRTRFWLLRQVTRLGAAAVDTLRQSLDGPEYDRDESGIVKIDSRGLPMIRGVPPTTQQLTTAIDLLNRLGVKVDDKSEVGDITSASILGEQERKKVELASDPSHNKEEQRALAREKARVAIQQLTQVLPQLIQKASGVDVSVSSEQEANEKEAS